MCCRRPDRTPETKTDPCETANPGSERATLNLVGDTALERDPVAGGFRGGGDKEATPAGNAEYLHHLTGWSEPIGPRAGPRGRREKGEDFPEAFRLRGL